MALSNASWIIDLRKDLLWHLLPAIPPTVLVVAVVSGFATDGPSGAEMVDGVRATVRSGGATKLSDTKGNWWQDSHAPEQDGCRVYAGLEALIRRRPAAEVVPLWEALNRSSHELPTILGLTEAAPAPGAVEHELDASQAMLLSAAFIRAYHPVAFDEYWQTAKGAPVFSEAQSLGLDRDETVSSLDDLFAVYQEICSDRPAREG